MKFSISLFISMLAGNFLLAPIISADWDRLIINSFGFGSSLVIVLIWSNLSSIYSTTKKEANKK